MCVEICQLIVQFFSARPFVRPLRLRLSRVVVVFLLVINTQKLHKQVCPQTTFYHSLFIKPGRCCSVTSHCALLTLYHPAQRPEGRHAHSFSALSRKMAPRMQQQAACSQTEMLALQTAAGSAERPCASLQATCPQNPPALSSAPRMEEVCPVQVRQMIVKRLLFAGTARL